MPRLRRMGVALKQLTREQRIELILGPRGAPDPDAFASDQERRDAWSSFCADLRASYGGPQRWPDLYRNSWAAENYGL